MTCSRVASIVLATSVSALFGCTSADKVVAANVQSSNDNQYNPATKNGRNGGLLNPGIPDGILHPNSSTPDALRKATKVRITLSQEGQTEISDEVTPAKSSWTVDKLDANGQKVTDSSGKTEQEPREAIGMFFDRITLTSGWKGSAQAKAEAIDDSGNVVLESLLMPFTVEEDGAVYVAIDLKLPEPPAAPAAGGSSSVGGATGTSTGTAGVAGTTGTANGGVGGTSSSGTASGGVGGTSSSSTS